MSGYILYIIQARFACLRCAACGHLVSAESPCGRLKLLNLNYFFNFFPLYIYIVNRGQRINFHMDPKILYSKSTPEDPMSTVESKFLAYF